MICGPFQVVQVFLLILTQIENSPNQFTGVSKQLLITVLISFLYYNFVVIRDSIIIVFIAAFKDAVGPAFVLFRTTLLFDTASFVFLSCIALILLGNERNEFCPENTSVLSSGLGECKAALEFLATNMGEGFILLFINVTCKLILWLVLHRFRVCFDSVDR